MSEPAAGRFSEGAAAGVREAIGGAGGNEVFLVGVLDAEGLVGSVEVVARGNEYSVPAIARATEGREVVIHNHPSGRLTPSGADLGVAGELGSEGIGFFIVDNDVEEVYVVVEPLGTGAIVDLDTAELCALLAPGGELERAFEGYEHRDSQVRMLELVATSFNENRVCVAEAGTGVGKSLAYLVPVLAWVGLNKERVIISTATINLQHQLLEKDIPMVKQLVGRDVRVELVKGRRNYLCRKRLESAVAELSLFEETNEELTALRGWAETTVEGSRSEYPTSIADDVWESVCSDGDSCRSIRCAHRDTCFYLRARREAAAASVLVVNHHLLFADLAIRVGGAGFDGSAVLPPAQRLVFDEAHDLESSATSFFSRSISHASIRRLVSRLHRRKKGRVTGLLEGVRGVLGEDPAGLAEVVPLADDVVSKAESLNDSCVSLLGDRGSFHLTRREEPVERLLFGPLEELAPALLRLAAACEKITDLGSEADDPEGVVFELRMVARRLRDAGEICGSFERFDEGPQTVFWIEGYKGRRGRMGARLIMTPLDVAPLMKDAIYDPFPTSVFTSATLTVGGEFSFWASRVGLESCGDRAQYGRFPSPFDYATRSLVVIPSDVVSPDSEGYEEDVAAMVGRALEISEGSALVLFTSHRMLRNVHERVRDGLSERGIAALRQGDDDRHRLLERFKADTSSVLFATSSFWQGVDAPGDSLRMVIVCRLPFRVPTDPVVKARTQALEADGGNAFGRLTLPDAVMRLTQGFGRLIRTNTDRGVVMILDSRVVTRRYGEMFLRSLPDPGVYVGDSEGVLARVEGFLYGN